MEQLAKFITDERTGLEYELCGDYYIIAVRMSLNGSQSAYGDNDI